MGSREEAIAETSAAETWKEAAYPECRFGGFTRVDGTVAFFQRVQALCRPSSVVLDIGCGRGAFAEDPVPLRRDLQTFKGKVACVIGIDVDEAAAANPNLDAFHLLQADRWPLEDHLADVAVSLNVVEHLEHPERFFGEARRVLKPGGYLCIKTPNAWSYVVVASRFVPNRIHASLLGLVQARRREQDVFPTLYRCNSVPRLRTHLDAQGFSHAVYTHEGEPNYLAFSRWAYRLGVLHQRLAPAIFRPVIMAFARNGNPA